ncbi:MAG: nitrile hydratase accessory protein [Pseudonocardia sp.]|nr:nitrile hydratase accessory protein [Pseudonocardia sp.]
MSTAAGSVVLDVEGTASPPRDNGELVFAEPWESRAFGMAVTLADAGAVTWDAFRERLIARIRRWEAEHGVDDPSFRYYLCWLGALEDLLVESGEIGRGDVVSRSSILASRPVGYDHADADAHGHGHGH